MARAVNMSWEKKVRELIAAGWHAEVEFKLSMKVKEKVNTCADVLENNLEGLLQLASEPSTGISLESEFKRAISLPNPKYALALMTLGVTSDSFQAKCGKVFEDCLAEKYSWFRSERPTHQSYHQEQLGIVIEAAYKLGWVQRSSDKYKWWEEA